MIHPQQLVCEHVWRRVSHGERRCIRCEVSLLAVLEDEILLLRRAMRRVQARATVAVVISGGGLTLFALRELLP